MIDIKSLTLQKLECHLSNLSIKPFKAKQLFKWIYEKGVFDFKNMTDISKKDQETLHDKFSINIPEIVTVNKSVDGTIKFALKLFDGEIIESVLIPDKERLTLCVSTQVGCKMGCRFCFTAKMGFKRNLFVNEILDQVIAGKFLVENELRKITNIVFMGMGEPFDNYENFTNALDVIMDKFGLKFSYRRITVSTCGKIDKMLQFGKNYNINLAVSIHAADDKKRNELMPVNKKYPIKKLIDACKKYPVKNRQRITFEYLMIKNFNDSIQDAKKLVRLLSNLKSKVNLIQFNTFPDSFYEPSDMETIRQFQDYVMSKGITVTLRKSKGSDILGACGQLIGKCKIANTPG